jgi:hypothetical protein
LGIQRRSWAPLRSNHTRHTSHIAWNHSSRQREGTVRDDVDVDAFAFILTAAMHHVLVTDEPFSAPDLATLARYVAGVAAQIDVSR